MIPTLSLASLQQRLEMNPDLLLFEALPEKYFDGGHIPGARQLVHTDPLPQMVALGASLDREIIVYCSNEACRNSHVAAQQLRRMGYERVAVFAGGKQAWSEAGLPLAGAAVLA